MSEKKSLANLKIFQKLKNIKHIEIIIAVIFAVIILLIYISSLNNSGSSLTKTQGITLETRLETILSDIEGAGDVSVLINSVDDKIDGVIVVASGAENISVKLNLLRAVQTVLKIPTAQIEILVGNK